MSRVRVYELAKEAGMASKVLAEKLIGLGYDIKGHSSTVDDDTAMKIRTEVLQNSESELVEKRIDAEKSGGPTVIRRRSTVIRRRPKKEPEEETSTFKSAFAPPPTEEKLYEPIISMTDYEVMDSTWGKPLKINRTETAFSVREQWVYPNNKYLYFEDGYLVSISSSR